ncbi:NAD(P)-dependent oxidoreductase [Kovacikia minuta]|uniref:NAD(P)-dependent oxidoreductase n=1 Tax=Kovacikia minuta TaxID=2931930 RepID=UPI0020C7D19E
MAQRILDAELPLTVYNRTADRVEPLKAAGAAIASSPDSLLQISTCIVLMLTNAEAVQSVLLSDTSRQELAGKTIIQMGTIAPSESKSIRDQVEAAGGSYLEAPVLGSIPEAKAGNLIVMVGSTPEQFTQWLTVLKCFGSDPVLVGPVGAATTLKLALNQLIGSLTAAFATSLGFVLRQGVEVELFMQILRESALYAPTFDKKLQRMVERNYTHPNLPNQTPA